MINFKEELINELKYSNLTLKDIKWIGTDKVEYELNDFLSKIDFDYDNGFGGTLIDMDLLIVGDNWWLERHEYDGSEWWEFKKYPERPQVKVDWVGYKEYKDDDGEYEDEYEDY